MANADPPRHLGAWITNALLGCLLLAITALGAVGRDAYNKLQADTQALHIQGARIEAQLQSVDRWISDHEGRQHTRTSANLAALEARVAVLEMAIQALRHDQRGD